MRHSTDAASADWRRSNRIFRRNGDWYFRTREGIDIGPYGSEFEAAIEASILMEVLKKVVSVDEAAAIVRGFLRDAVKLKADEQTPAPATEQSFRELKVRAS